MKSNKLSKIFISVLLALVMVFSFAACASNEDNKPNGDNTGNNTDDGNTVTSIDLQSTLAINVDDERTLQATLLPFGTTAAITWKSSDKDVATVTDGGVVKGISQGTAIVRATAGGKSANCTVTVTDPKLATVNVTKVTFTTGGVVTLTLGGDVAEATKQLAATVSPENATNKTLTWASSNTGVVTVDQTGKVTAVAVGQANITATAHNNTKATCIVKVVNQSGSGDLEDEQTSLYVKKIDSLEGRDDFIMGMDASAVPSLEDAGVVYADADGTVKDVYRILKDNGITDIRIRIWNDPYKAGGDKDDADYIKDYSYGGGNCDVANAVKIAERCEAVGLGVIIDFHYSDFWADPGKQFVPKAWKNYTTSQIENAIYEFTKSSLQEIKTTGVKITMVQIGNETTRAICGADFGSAPATYCAYISAGARAVREVTGAVADGGAKVAIHLTNPESRDFVGYANTFANNNVDYDVFGSSYYPYWHGSLANLANKLKNVHDACGKEVMVLETSYAFVNYDFDGCGNTRLDSTTEPLTVQGQSNQIRNVIQTIADLGDYGLGVCYWEGTWVGASSSSDRATNIELYNKYGCGWASANAGPTSIGGDGYQASDVSSAGGCVIDNQAFFKWTELKDGSEAAVVLPSLKVFKLAKEGQIVPPAADYLYDEEVFCTVGEGTITLPAQVKIALNTGSVMDVAVYWDVDTDRLAEYINEVNTYPIKGTTDYGGSVTCTVYVQNKNILADGGFEDTEGYGSKDSWIVIPTPWAAEQIKTSNTLQLYVSNDSGNAEMGTNSFHFWDTPSVEFKLYQQVNLDAARNEYGNGIYSFSIEMMGGDFGEEQDIYAYAIITYNDGTQALTVEGNHIEATGWLDWHKSTVSEIEITANVASVTVGIYVKGESVAGPWGNIDNAQFFYNGN